MVFIRKLIFKEFCVCICSFTLSETWLDFQEWAKEKSIYDSKFELEIWNGIFSSYKPYNIERLKKNHEEICKNNQKNMMSRIS